MGGPVEPPNNSQEQSLRHPTAGFGGPKKKRSWKIQVLPTAEDCNLGVFDTVHWAENQEYLGFGRLDDSRCTVSPEGFQFLT